MRALDLRFRALAGPAAALAVVLAVSAGPVGPLAPAAAEEDATGGAGASACDTALLPAAMPAQDATPQLDTAEKQDVAELNDTTVKELVADAKDDPTLWLDPCGHTLFVEENAAAQVLSASKADAASGALSTPQAGATYPIGDVSAATGSGPIKPLSQTFGLSSKPGSKYTIYLDFTGATTTGTAWNDEVGQTSITSPAYTIDSDATTFTPNELTQIQRTWAVVADDYAPFDVNVTTADPGTAAIDRTGRSDTAYGQQVIITAGGPVYDAMGQPGGTSYVGTFDYYGTNGHGYYQPSWVFTKGTTPRDGKYIGEAASHEAGHSLGLSHDGTTDTQTADDYGYYLGDDPWAAIMGAGYYEPVTQWSKGEYPKADDDEDDIAIINQMLPFRADDHGDTAAAATPVTVGSTVDGAITTATDKDAFTFTAAGKVTIAATPSDLQPDLDLKATILDASGATVATVDPAVVDNGEVNPAGGLDATYTLTAPAAGATYTVILDGTGSGDPAVAGKYDDYGSEGPYQLSVASTATVPLTIANADGSTGALTVTGSTTTGLDVTPFTAAGGTGGYTWTATGLPTGVSIASSTGHLSGTAAAAGSYPVTVTVTDASGATATAKLTLAVSAPSPLVFSPATYTATAGQTLRAQLSATGGVGGYTYAASGQPGWLSVSSSGALTGTPTSAGTATFPVTATSGTQSVRASVTVTVVSASLATSGGTSEPTSTPATPPVAVDPQAFSGTVGSALSGQLAATGGSGSYAWSIVSASSSLPVSVDGSGRLTGTPTRTGTWSFTARATDAADASQHDQATMTLTVSGRTAQVSVAPVAIATHRVTAKQGKRFRIHLHARGGTGSYRWTALHPPRGVRLTPAGVLTGKVAAPGRTRLRVKVTSGTSTYARSASRVITLVVKR